MSKLAFIDGMHDCREGIPCRKNMSDEYVRGYRLQYEMEQMEAEMGRDHVVRKLPDDVKKILPENWK